MKKFFNCLFSGVYVWVDGREVCMWAQRRYSQGKQLKIYTLEFFNYFTKKLNTDH